MEVRKKLGFDKILEHLEKYLNPIGKTLLERVEFSRNYEQINRELSLVSEFVEIEANHNFPADHFYDLRPTLDKISVKGTYPEPDELLRLWKSQETLKNIQRFLNKQDFAGKFPNVKHLAAEIKIFPYITDRISRIIDRNGTVLDTASKELLAIRRELASKEHEAAKIVQTIFKQAQKQGLIPEGENPVIRNGRLLLPLEAGKKNQIQGIVQDYSGTGKTIYIEPIKAVEINNRIAELENEEKREIVRILTEFADDLRPYIPELRENYNVLAKIDFTRGKARLALETDAHKPKLVDKPVIDLVRARHPLLLFAYKGTGREVIPLSIQLNEEQRIVLISGPNAGGKSVALKTVGLLQYMTQSGFLIPARFNSTMGIFDNIFVDIGDDQSIENDLSTYSSHLMKMKEILENATDKSLVLIDEFGSGTDPAMGGAIAEAILEELLTRKTKAVITTHYSNLKYFAAEHNSIANAAMLFDTENLKPLYKLETGRPGSSFAFEIASSIGLDKKIIEKAQEKLGKQQVDFDKIIQDIEHERRRIHNERQNLEQTKKELQDKVVKYRTQYEKLLKERKKIIEQANAEAEEILSKANSLIEKTIKEIKEKNAEKEATKIARKQFEKNKQELEKQKKEKAEKIEKQLRETQQKLKKDKQKNKPQGELTIGSYARDRRSGLKGQIREIKDGVALLEMGNFKSFVKLKDLEPLASDEKKQLKKLEKKGGVKIDVEKQETFVSALDLRGMRAEEALAKTAKFIDSAIIAGNSEVRILHGTGDGILRKLVRDYLRGIDQVQWYGDADVRVGGAGVTVVRFK